MIKNYYEKVITNDLHNKFSYSNIKKVVKIKKISLNFCYKTPNFENVAATLLALELLTNKSSHLTTAHQTKLSVRVQKGQVISCYTHLYGSDIYIFLKKLISEIFPQIKNHKGIKEFKSAKKTFSLTLTHVVNFRDFSNSFHLFNKTLSFLNISFVTNAQKSSELKLILKALNFPLN